MIAIFKYPHIGIFLLGFFLAYIFTDVLIVLGKKLNTLDYPGQHKGHKKPTPFFGGLAIYAAFTLAILSTLRFSSLSEPVFGILLGAAVIVILGLLDDFFQLPAVFKLFVLIMTVLILSYFGIITTLTPWHPVNLIISLLWMVGITSAINSLDNTDGVAAGTSGITALAIFAIAWESKQVWLSFSSMALAGACIGFLRFNFNPAKCFLGDNGSLLLGFLLSSILIMGNWDTDPIKASLIPILLLSTPIADITIVTLLRYRSGYVKSLYEAITYCGRDHLAHRLLAAGYSVRQTALLFYLFATLAAFLGYHIWDKSLIYSMEVVTGFLILTWLLSRYLENQPVDVLPNPD